MSQRSLGTAKDWIERFMSDEETRHELEQRMDALARRFAETHDEAVRAEILELARCFSEMKTIH